MGLILSLHKLVMSYLPKGLGQSLTTIDKALAGAGLPKGSSSLLFIILTLVTGVVVSKILSAGRAGATTKSKRKTGDSILLLGDTNTGKTALLHLLLHGKVPQTVTSLQEQVAVGPLAGDETPNPAVHKFVDFPGHARLRGQGQHGRLAPYLAAAKAVVFLMDASSLDIEHIRRSAEYLYDVFTNPAFVGKDAPVLIWCNKSEGSSPVAPDTFKARLAAQLNVLKTTRASLQSTDEAASTGTILLGNANSPFDFDIDSPSEVSFAAGSVQGKNVQAVVDFIHTV